MVSSYNGFQASKNPHDIGVTVTFKAAGVAFPAGVKSGAVATVFAYLADQYHKRVEPLEVPGCWGYYFKASANSAALISCHSSGTAVDFNAPKHPNGKKGTFTKAQVAQIRAIQDELGGVVYWGGDSWGGGTTDEMHFEIKTGVTEAQVRAVADRLHTSPAADAAQPIEWDDDMIMISSPGRGQAVCGPGYFYSLPTPPWVPVAAAICSKTIEGNDAQFDMIRAMCTQGRGTDIDMQAAADLSALKEMQS